MYQEKRPTCVSVIGWAWIVIGVLMCLSSVFMLAMMMADDMLKEARDMSFLFYIFPLLAVVQVGAGILAIVSGINFLKLKSWSRIVLEVLTWIFLVVIIVYMVLWSLIWFLFPSGFHPTGFLIVLAIMAVVISGIYAVPLIIMLKYLRGPKVKNALNGINENTSPHSCPEGLEEKPSESGER